MKSKQVSHPILRLDVLEPDGSHETDNRVFCRKQGRSVRVEECVPCAFCDVIIEGARPSVDCTIPDAPLSPAEDPTGERTEIGVLLKGDTLVIAQSASLGAALRIMRAEDRRSVAIVDDKHVLVGLVRETGFLGHAPPGEEEELQAAMSTPVAVHESTPVRTALRLLAASHLREITVVSEEGIPLGVFRDVDGLHWIAEARDAAHEDEGNDE
jgi:CBS domain-containing protein